MTRQKKLMTVGRKNPNRLRILLFAIVFTVTGLILTVFLKDRQIPDNVTDKVPALGHTGMLVSGFHQKSTKNGKDEWTLDAAKVRYLAEEKRAVFQDLSIIFHLEEGKQIYLTAKSGGLDRETRDIHVSDSVEVKSEDYILETEKLYYSHSSRNLSSKVPVKIDGPAFSLSADSMSMDLQNNKAVLKGNVEGTLSEDISL